MRKRNNKAEQAERVKALASMVLEIEQDLNQVLTETKQVRPVYMAHYINLKTGKMGIEDCIAETLTERKATSQARAMLANEITDAVNLKFRQDTSRYPESTIAQYLCNSGGKFCKRHSFVKVPTGSNPHFAYYLAPSE